MQCPDRAGWRALLEHRFRSSESPPPEWEESRRHLRTCARCRTVATRLDGALLWTLLPATEEGSELPARRLAAEVLGRVRTSPLDDRGAWRTAVGVAALLVVASTVALTPLDRRAVTAVASPPVAAPESGATAGSAEVVGRPGARIYELADEGIAVVLIVDESLDV